VAASGEHPDAVPALGDSMEPIVPDELESATPLVHIKCPEKVHYGVTTVGAGAGVYYIIQK
jgi:hypothetical protein